MICDCKECGGSGVVTCCGCDGQGRIQRSLLTANIKAIRRLDDDETAQLLELQNDARRCVEQATILKELNPKCAASYDQQLADTLAKLEREADTILK